METTGFVSKLKVSIVCNTFNHEKYIKQALDSFIMQIVNFDYEILVHDDASTDNTAKILREYEIMYPDKFKIIFQKVNQYSKGISVNYINISRSVGEYIAICEGDDYWLDPYKLQKQVDYLDHNSKCLLVVHGSLKINANNPFVQRKWLFTYKSRILSTDEIIKNRAIIAAHNSFMYRNVEQTYPVFFNTLGVWDVTRLLYFSSHGTVYYISEIMSVYRIGTLGSWNERIRLNELKLIKHYEKEMDFYRSLNKYTDYIYDSSIQNVILDIEYEKLKLTRDYEGIESVKYENKLDNRSLYDTLLFVVQKKFPSIFKLLRYYRFKYWI